MSNAERRKVSVEDIQLVQNLIERCLQLYMSQKEVVNTLLHQAKIEPGFTELVWQKLQAENLEFFKAYNLRLIVKDQILRFNQLLDRQIQLMRQLYPTVVSCAPLSDGPQINPIHNSSAYHSSELSGPSLSMNNIHQHISTVPNAYNNGASSFQQGNPNAYSNGASSLLQTMANAHGNGESSLQQSITNEYNSHESLLPPSMPVADNMVGHVGSFSISANMPLDQNSNAGMIQGMNVGMISPEASHANEPRFIFGADRSVQEPSTKGDASMSPFAVVDSNSQAFNETFLDPDTNAFGLMGMMGRNFSFSDLTAHFTNDILESYSKSPYLEMNANFSDPEIGGEQDIKRLHTVSEGFCYKDLGSD